MLKLRFTILIVSVIVAYPCFSQPEVAAWGNVMGIRIEGQLMKFETSFQVAGQNWSQVMRTAKERQRSIYKRDGSKQIITAQLGNFLDLTETVGDTGKGRASINVQYTSKVDTSVIGTFFSIRLPYDHYGDGSAEVIDLQKISLSDSSKSDINEILRSEAKGIKIKSGTRQFEVTTHEASLIIVKRHTTNFTGIEILIELSDGEIKKEQTVSQTFSIQVEGEIDRSPVEMVMNVDKPGRTFVGFGGNFRLQNSKTDPQVIDFCLKNLRVAHARVEMPWRFWHPEENADPVLAAREGKLHERVKGAMEMAQRLHKMGIPVITSAWFGPDWAIVGPRATGRQPNGMWGNPLNQDKIERIYKSITDYILYMKENYGVEAEMFSFNESDLGIDIRQTAAEHRDLIKGLGAYFKSKGLKTKLLLGDTADANGWPFLQETFDDPATLPYIGAVSFHSWRGWETETLKKWAAAAERAGKPLIVGEGSIDAAAWRYPSIFEEQIYAIEEINLYVRLLAICQPKSILQWQLTADYSPLAGGGIFGNNEPLRPTRRFWQLKQLSYTPKDLAAMPISCKGVDISCAALGDNKKNTYAIHIVNNGATREATVSGFPKRVKKLRLFVTDSKRGMEELGKVDVTDGLAKFALPEVSYVTLISGK